jgi:hypothetical protein
MSNASKQPTGIEDTGTGDEHSLVDPKDEIAIRMGEHRLEQARRQQEESARRARMRVFMILGAIALSVAGYFAWRYLSSRRADRTGPNQQGLSVKVDKTEDGKMRRDDFIDYLLTRATATQPDGKVNELRRFEFDSNRFLPGGPDLDNAGKFRSTLASEAVRADLNGALVVIFAGASFDKDPEFNQQLCRQRVLAVASLLRDQQGLSPKGFWGIPGGEKRPEGRAAVSEAEEDRLAARMSEKERRSPRALIIISIRGASAATDVAQNPQEVVRQLAPALYANGLLPTDYDSREAEPAPINLPPK